MKGFRFIGIKDYGTTSCPHCGAEGRYIYEWEVDGKRYSAMAGCYKALTAHIVKSDIDNYFTLIAEKQAKGKNLNNWDKSIIRLLDFKANGKYPEQWCDMKIAEVMRERATYLNKRHF